MLSCTRKKKEGDSVDFDKIAINSAIQQLLDDPFNAEAADTIIQFGNTLQAANRILRIESRFRRTSKKDVTGHTREHGNVNVPIEHTQTKDFSNEGAFERIGLYKIWKESEDLIFFQYFWKASLSTQGLSEAPQKYGIFYDPDTLEYHNLVEEIEVPIFTFRSSVFGKVILRSLKDGQESFAGYFWHCKISR